MEFIKPSAEILSVTPGALKMIEIAGRTCYKSEDKITNNSAEGFVNMLISRGHHAMVEFADIIVKCKTDRGVSHELVRHRHCSFAQESTRYVTYDKENIEYIKPAWCSEKLLGIWSLDNGPFAPNIEHGAERIILSKKEAKFVNSCLQNEKDYIDLLAEGWIPQQARQVLNNSLKTEICVKTNLRDWINIMRLRYSKLAHPNMQELMKIIRGQFGEIFPSVFKPKTL